MDDELVLWLRKSAKWQRKWAADVKDIREWCGNCEEKPLPSERLDAAADALLSFREENARRDWQPIETAPKDGTCILIAGGIYDWDSSWGETLPFSGVTIASWNDIRTGKPWQGENCGGHDEYYRYAPTHWMPLPEPPRAALAPTQRKE